MASGRIFQMRINAVSQASLVWALTSEASEAMVENFIKTGTLDLASEKLPNMPLAEKMIAYIHQNGGKLIVDQEKFRQMAEEVSHRKPL